MWEDVPEHEESFDAEGVSGSKKRKHPFDNKLDRRTLNHLGGRKHRIRYSSMYKSLCIVKYDEAVVNGEGAPVQYVEELEDIPGNLSRWVRDRVQILKSGGDARRKLLTTAQQRNRLGRFHEAEKKLHLMFLPMRKRGRRVTERWLCVNAVKLVTTMYKH